MDWVVALLVGVAAGGSGVYLYLKSTSNKTLLKARSTADAIVADARQEAEQLKKELLIEAESEAFDQKQQVERDLDRRRAQLNDLEARLDTREMDIDRKAEVVNKKESELLQLEEDLARKEERVTAKTDELNRLIIDQIQKLEEISGLTREEAKHLLLKDLEEEATEEEVVDVKMLRYHHTRGYLACDYIPPPSYIPFPQCCPQRREKVEVKPPDGMEYK